MKSWKILIILNLIYFTQSLLPTKEYIEPEQQFRGVWVTIVDGDGELIRYNSMENFIDKMTYILDTIKMYNMNTLIFHVRTENNALYKSKLNPTSYYFEKVDFDRFDPLKWLIEESHKRGIDFHAWMNPYRIKINNKLSLDYILSQYKDYKGNPANDEKCIINGTTSIILNPGLEKVRRFIVQTINEFLEKYDDVDAIHFDDYFYCDMGANGKLIGNFTILDEQDQETYEDYIKNNPSCNYNNKNSTDKANWRREQINILISQLHEEIGNFNIKNNKKIQFGISPTGVYKNGDGKVIYDMNNNAITKGSLTKGLEHYSDFLFADTLKWINNGWIDYILPQSYKSMDDPIARYGNVMSWWDKVVEYKNINLFSGIGLYKADYNSNTYGWNTNTNEFYDELIYVANGKNIEGVAIYNFNNLRKLRDKKNTISAKQIENGVKAWKYKVPSSEIKSFEKIKLKKTENLQFKNKTLIFNKIKGAKFYVVYRSKNNILFNSNEIIDIFGSNDNIVNWIEKEEGYFNYGIRGLSYSNTLGEGFIYNYNESNYLSLRISLFTLLLLFLFVGI